MICLENRTFAVSQTTLEQGSYLLDQLWFAWKIVLLQYRKQQEFSRKVEQFRCDLLGKSYFCSIANNPCPKCRTWSTVVICLENRTFAVSQTTGAYQTNREGCCDLLGKSYFCSIANNCIRGNRIQVKVVICLENRTFAVSQTTRSFYSTSWWSCDLLGKSYFCSIANNLWFSKVYPLWVVICLENRTFAVSQTTRHIR